MKVKKTHLEKSSFSFSFEVTKNLITEDNSKATKPDVAGLEQVVLLCQGEIKKKADTFFIVGNYNAAFSSVCHYCLENFKFTTTSNLDMLLVPETDFEKNHSQRISNQQDVCYYSTSDEEIDLLQYYQEQLILDLPLTIRCQKECKGLCGSCGINLNKKNCNCNQKEVHNPFKEYFSKKIYK